MSSFNISNLTNSFPQIKEAETLEASSTKPAKTTSTPSEPVQGKKSVKGKKKKPAKNLQAPPKFKEGSTLQTLQTLENSLAKLLSREELNFLREFREKPSPFPHSNLHKLLFLNLFERAKDENVALSEIKKFFPESILQGNIEETLNSKKQISLFFIILGLFMKGKNSLENNPFKTDYFFTHKILQKHWQYISTCCQILYRYQGMVRTPTSLGFSNKTRELAERLKNKGLQQLLLRYNIVEKILTQSSFETFLFQSFACPRHSNFTRKESLHSIITLKNMIKMLVTGIEEGNQKQGFFVQLFPLLELHHFMESTEFNTETKTIEKIATQLHYNLVQAQLAKRACKEKIQKYEEDLQAASCDPQENLLKTTQKRMACAHANLAVCEIIEEVVQEVYEAYEAYLSQALRNHFSVVTLHQRLRANALQFLERKLPSLPSDTISVQEKEFYPELKKELETQVNHFLSETSFLDEMIKGLAQTKDLKDLRKVMQSVTLPKGFLDSNEITTFAIKLKSLVKDKILTFPALSSKDLPVAQKALQRILVETLSPLIRLTMITRDLEQLNKSSTNLIESEQDLLPEELQDLVLGKFIHFKEVQRVTEEEKKMASLTEALPSKSYENLWEEYEDSQKEKGSEESPLTTVYLMSELLPPSLNKPHEKAFWEKNTKLRKVIEILNSLGLSIDRKRGKGSHSLVIDPKGKTITTLPTSQPTLALGTSSTIQAAVRAYVEEKK